MSSPIRYDFGGDHVGNNILAGNKLKAGGDLNIGTLKELQPNFFQTSDYELFKRAIAPRAPNTCNWVLEHPTFITWRQEEQEDILWLTADPGCGKSVLSKALIDERLVGLSTTSSIYYFFFKHNDEQNGAALAVCAVLHQLFCKHPGLSKKYAVSSIRNYGEALKKNLGELWRILLKVTRDNSTGEVICILDALDECKQADRNDLIAQIAALYKDSLKERESTRKLKFLLTSQPYDDIERQFLLHVDDVPTIRLAGEDESEKISMEINKVIKIEVAKLERIQHLNEIRDTLGHTNKKLDALIDVLPETVGEAYEKILARCGRKSEAKQLLEIIVAAYRPLTVNEIDVALEIKPDSTSFAHLDVEGRGPRKRWIRRSCGLFVNIVDDRVMLIHETAKQFLIRRTAHEHTGHVWRQSIDLAEAQMAMTKKCVTFLLFEEFLVNDAAAWNTSLGRGNEFQVLAKRYAFFDYSSFFWHNHVTNVTFQEREWYGKIASLCEFRFGSSVAWFGSLFGMGLPLDGGDDAAEKVRQWVDWTFLTAPDLLRLPALFWMLSTGMQEVAWAHVQLNLQPKGQLKSGWQQNIHKGHICGEYLAMLVLNIRTLIWWNVKQIPFINTAFDMQKPVSATVLVLERSGDKAAVSRGTAMEVTDGLWRGLSDDARLPLLVKMEGHRLEIIERSYKFNGMYDDEIKVVLIVIPKGTGHLDIVEGALEAAMNYCSTGIVKIYTPPNSTRCDLDIGTLFRFAARNRYVYPDRPIQNDEFLVMWCCLEAIRIAANVVGIHPPATAVTDGYLFWILPPAQEHKARDVLQKLRLPMFYWADGNQARFFALRWVHVCLLIFWDYEASMDEMPYGWNRPPQTAAKWNRPVVNG